MPTTHYRLSRKELKQPDEFISFLDKIGIFLAENLTRVILGTVAAIALIGTVFGLYFYSQYQQRMASEDFYQAVTALDHKDYNAAQQEFAKIAEERSRQSLGRLAQFYLATTYMAQEQPAKARAALEKYLNGDDPPMFRQLALTQLGVADENLGDFNKAHDAYVQAAAMDGPEKVRAELGAARVLAKHGNKQGAVGAYQRFLKQNPFSEDRADVVEALAQLGAAPEQPEEHAKTIEVTPAKSASRGISKNGASTTEPK